MSSREASVMSADAVTSGRLRVVWPVMTMSASPPSARAAAGSWTGLVSVPVAGWVVWAVAGSAT